MKMWQIRMYDMNHFWNEDYDSMKLIKEVEEEPDTDGIMEIYGKTYRWCSKSPKNKVIGVEEINFNPNPEDEEYGDDFKCPYCGEVDQDAWELSSDEDKVDCPSCGSEIEFQREYQVTYTVAPAKAAKVVRL